MLSVWRLLTLKKKRPIPFIRSWSFFFIMNVLFGRPYHRGSHPIERVSFGWCEIVAHMHIRCRNKSCSYCISILRCLGAMNGHCRPNNQVMWYHLYLFCPRSNSCAEIVAWLSPASHSLSQAQGVPPVPHPYMWPHLQLVVARWTCTCTMHYLLATFGDLQLKLCRTTMYVWPH